MAVNKAASTTRVKDPVTGDEVNLGTKLDGTTKAMHVISETQTDSNNPPIVSFPSQNYDLFGRLRVSNINNIFESTHVNSEQTEFWDTKTIGGGLKIYNMQKASVDLSVGTASGDLALRQTLNYFHYGAGQPLLIRATGVLTAGMLNQITGVCYGDDNNGLHFRTKDGIFQVGVTSNTSGVPVETFIDQANFNLDKMDGTGPSGITLDLNKAQIFQISFEWLGVGDALFSILINKKQVDIHSIENMNALEDVYMRTPHLPVRYKIENTGVTASGNTIKQICTQVANEGNALVGDLTNAIDNGTNTVSVNTSSFKPILSYRHKVGVNILSEIISVMNMVTTNDDVMVYVIVDAALTGEAWVDYSQFIEADFSASSYTGGRKIAAVSLNKNDRTGSEAFKSKFRLGNFIDGTAQTITVAAKAFSSNANISPILTIKELF